MLFMGIPGGDETVMPVYPAVIGLSYLPILAPCHAVRYAVVFLFVFSVKRVAMSLIIYIVELWRAFWL